MHVHVYTWYNTYISIILSYIDSPADKSLDVVWTEWGSSLPHIALLSPNSQHPALSLSLPPAATVAAARAGCSNGEEGGERGGGRWGDDM